MYSAKLYKLDSTGKLRFWEIKTFRSIPNCQGMPGDIDYGYKVSHGIEGSNNIVSSSTLVKPKNLGKKNATTPEQQADFEAESLMKKQMDKNYTPNKNQAAAKDVGLLPMLAQRYDQHPAKFIFPGYIQPKLDGLRCLAVVRDGDIRLISRKGKEFKAVKHLKQKIAQSLGYLVLGQLAIPDDIDIILDGELYSHDMTFQEIISATKRDKANDESEKIEYHIYDTIQEEHFYDRHWWLRKNIISNENVKLVWTFEVYDEAEIISRNQENIKRGFEGSILRNKEGFYECDKRSYNLLKVKEFLDDEFEIVGAEESVGKRAGQACFVCKTKKGAEFTVNMMGTDADRTEYWTNRADYIGKFVTVRFFEWTTSEKPVPRFGVGVAVRDYD